MAWASCYSPEFRVVSIVGAAAGTTAANDRRLVESLTGAPTFVLNSIDTGRYALHLDHSVAGMNFSLSRMAASPRYIGVLMRFKLGSLTAACNFMRFVASTTTENVVLRSLASTGEITYSFNNGTSATNSGVFLTAGTIYNFEAFVDFGTGTTHTLKVRLNGVEVINVTGGAAAVTAVDPVFGSTNVQSSTMDIADCATYNDVAEYATMDDWRVHGLEPTSDGTHSFTANDFQDNASTNLTTAATTSWQKVDDAPGAAPSTTDHIKQVVIRTTGYMEWVHRALPAGYNAPKLVCLAAALHPVAAATANTVAFRLNANANVSAEAAVDTSVAADTLEYRMHIYPTRPGGAAWLVGDVNGTNLRSRFGYSGDATPPPACDSIMAFVLTPVAPTRGLTDTLISGTPSVAASFGYSRPITDTLLSGAPSITATPNRNRALIDAILTPAGFTPGANDIIGTSFESEASVGDIFTGGAAGVVAFSTANPRTGTRHIRASLVGNADSLITFPASLRQFTARFSIYLSALPTGTSRIFTVDGSSPASRLSITAGGALQSFVGASSGVTVATLSINTLYVVDVAFDMTTATYQWKVRVNGGTTQTQSIAGTSADIADLDFWSTWTGTVTFDLDDLHITKQFSDYPLSDMVGGAFDTIVATFQAGGGTFSRPITDTLLTSSDSIAIQLAAPRNLTDTLVTPSDSIQRTVAAPRGMTDTLVAPSDSIVATKAAPRGLTDTLVTPSDSIARTLVATRTLTDTLLSGSPTLSALKTASRPLTDTLVTPSDSIVRTLAAPRPLTDQLTTFSDTVARTFVATRSLTDTLLTFSPTLVAARSFSIPLTTTLLTPSDTIVRTLVAPRPLTDQLLTPSDSIVRTYIATRSIADTLLTFSPTVSALKVAPRPLTDTLVTPSDSIASALVASRVISDTLLTFSPSVTAQRLVNRPITDTLLTPSDSIIRTLAAPRALTDTLLTFAPSISAVKGPLRNITDTLLTFSPTVSIALVLTRPLTDTLLTPSDSIVATKIAPRALTDTLLTPSDSIIRTLIAPRPITDTLLTFSPSVTAQRLVTRALTDTLLTPSDSIVRTLLATRTISDTLLTFSPSISVIKGPVRAITDNLLVFSPTVSISLVLTRPLTDQLLTFSPSVAITQALTRALADQLLTFSPTVATQLLLTRPLTTQLLTFSPSLTVTVARNVPLTTTLLTPSDVIAIHLALQRGLTDTILPGSVGFSNLSTALVTIRTITTQLLSMSDTVSASAVSFVQAVMLLSVYSRLSMQLATKANPEMLLSETTKAAVDVSTD